MMTGEEVEEGNLNETEKDVCLCGASLTKKGGKEMQ